MIVIKFGLRIKRKEKVNLVYKKQKLGVTFVSHQSSFI
jgi:hypothetical protein